MKLDIKIEFDYIYHIFLKINICINEFYWFSINVLFLNIKQFQTLFFLKSVFQKYTDWHSSLLYIVFIICEFNVFMEKSSNFSNLFHDNRDSYSLLHRIRKHHIAIFPWSFWSFLTVFAILRTFQSMSCSICYPSFLHSLWRLL